MVCPLTGIVLEYGRERHGLSLIPPPYGDGTMTHYSCGHHIKFSSPYGDCTKSCAIWLDGRLFSPPYGDSITGHTGGNKICLVFAPLRGWYSSAGYLHHRKQVFAPLRGWYPRIYQPERPLFVFAPLRGWYTKYITKHRKTEEPDG